MNPDNILSLLKLKISTFAKSFFFYMRLGAVSKVGQKWIERSAITLSKEQNALVEVVRESLIYSNRKTYFPCKPSIRFPVGMSGQRFRSFLNFLSNKLLDFNYLEIGVWRGSTANAVLKGNCREAILIDNWSEFGGPKDKAKKKLKKFIRSGRVTLIDRDFNDIAFSKKFNCDVYLYDGAHDYCSHFESISFLEKLEFENLIMIVDDWNWQNVKKGTLEGINQHRVNLIYEFELETSPKDVKGRYSSWHNGTWIAVISSTNKSME